MRVSQTDLLPPNQEIQACHALLGDLPAQREVLELAVHLAESGIEPIEVFKKAALHSLRLALERGKLPPRHDAKVKGSAGAEFQLAVAWEKAQLTGSKKPAAAVAADIDPKGERNLLPAINRARKRHGDLSARPNLAKERALFELAWYGTDGPDGRWFKEWVEYRRQLSDWWRDKREMLPPESAELLEKLSRF